MEFAKCDPAELAQMRQFNKKLAWMPRFKIRNRVTPRVIQALLRISQLRGDQQLARHGLTAETRKIAVDGVAVPLRIIRPEGKVQGVVLDFHGGGWVIGNAQMDDAFNLAMVKACNVATVSVDYRLAVSTPIAELMNDCLGAARWLLGSECEEFAGLPVIVVGESAGAHLAAATLLSLKAWPQLLKRVRGAMLYYGVYDLTGTPSVRTAGPDTLLLDGPGMVEALRMLTPELSDAQRRQPPLSPLYGDFSGLPPALMFVGELDPLRDDTLDIAERWGKVAQVEVHQLPECAHGFIHFPTALADRVLRYSREWINAHKTGQGIFLPAGVTQG
ncbi:alpha/beta hydrolase [Pseudomonas mandelii]|uniref:alpha/beta hydrolase n=1 Tax=Pseudomonas mandelii TaxID=75612 RepID=UPI00224A913D|nr:alpha/beta hydrolase [Pseudomonas mandelii]MCX2898770.1 alpha/beta hydrolase [Pseudomonas mandelii]